MIEGYSERVFIGVGSNLGDRRTRIEEAIRVLSETPQIVVVAQSGLYETEPIGPIEQPPFLNSVVELRTSLEPERLLICLKQIERDSGRQMRERWGPREIDLDVLLMGSRQIDTPDLKIPHPEMHLRRFVLVPLAELAPDVTHPSLDLRIESLLARLKDERGVQLLQSEPDRKGPSAPDQSRKQSQSKSKLKKRS